MRRQPREQTSSPNECRTVYIQHSVQHWLSTNADSHTHLSGAVDSIRARVLGKVSFYGELSTTGTNFADIILLQISREHWSGIATAMKKVHQSREILEVVIAPPAQNRLPQFQELLSFQTKVPQLSEQTKTSPMHLKLWAPSLCERHASPQTEQNVSSRAAVSSSAHSCLTRCRKALWNRNGKCLTMVGTRLNPPSRSTPTCLLRSKKHWGTTWFRKGLIPKSESSLLTRVLQCHGPSMNLQNSTCCEPCSITGVIMCDSGTTAANEYRRFNRVAVAVARLGEFFTEETPMVVCCVHWAKEGEMVMASDIICLS